MAKRKPKRKPSKSSAQVAREAIDLGKQRAATALKERAQARQVRRNAHMARASVLGRPVPAHLRALAAALPPGSIVAEGDSWFDYPGHDVLKALDDVFGYDVDSVAHKGDAVEEMAYADGQIDDFARLIEKKIAQQSIPKAILLSGGGNDIAGDEFHMLLNHVGSPLAGINDSVVDGIINQRIRAAYISILSVITELCRQQTGRVIRIIVHGYAHPVPDGRGFLGGFWFLPGPWLRPGFIKKGFDDLNDNTAMMQDLIDRFNAMVQDVAALPEFGHVRYVDLRGTLSNTIPGSDYKDSWANELHPTKDAFSAVAAEFVRAIEAP